MEKKNVSANMCSHSFFERFKNYKTDIMISSMIEAVRKENGLIVFEMGNGDQYFAQFTTNGIESMNAELKRVLIPSFRLINSLTTWKWLLMLKKINTVTQFQILEILASAINIKTLPLPANSLCGMQQKANFIGNLFFKKTSYLQPSL